MNLMGTLILMKQGWNQHSPHLETVFLWACVICSIGLKSKIARCSRPNSKLGLRDNEDIMIHLGSHI